MSQAGQVTCPHCGQNYKLTPEQEAKLAGRTFRCTKCQQSFTLAGSAAAPVYPAVAPQVAPPRPPPPPPPSPPPSPTVAAAPPLGYQQPLSYGAPPAQQSNGLAITSLICGCVLCVPFIPGLLATIFGIIGLKKTRDPQVGGKGFAIAGLILGIVNLLGWTAYFVLIVAIMVPSLNRARETANRVKCASNMRQIGQAVLLYSNENRGAYPPRLEELITTQDIEATCFVCPSCSDTAATGATVEEIADNLSTGGHLSYVYLGAGKRSSIGPDEIVLYEPITNHNGDGVNLLFGDGHVEFFAKAQAEKALSELQAGKNPPPSLAPAQRRSFGN